MMNRSEYCMQGEGKDRGCGQASANDCLSGFFRAEACPLPKAAVLSLLHRSAAASAPCHAHAHPPHQHLLNVHIHHNHQPRAYQAQLPFHKTGPVSHGITGDRIRSARQGRDLGDGAGSTCKEKDTQKTGTTQACGSSSLPRTLTHRLSYCHRQRLLN
jgi:hypothetical protein